MQYLLLPTCETRVLALVINGEFEKYIGRNFAAEKRGFSTIIRVNRTALISLIFSGRGEKNEADVNLFPRRKTINKAVSCFFALFSLSFFFSLPLYDKIHLLSLLTKKSSPFSMTEKWKIHRNRSDSTHHLSLIFIIFLRSKQVGRMTDNCI